MHSLAEIYNLFLNSNGVCTDTRKIQKGDFFVALKGPNFNGNLFAEKALELGANTIIVDENVSIKDPKVINVANGLKFLQELANYHRKKINIPFIAITGSNGKTTTKELLYAVLSTK